MVTLDNSRLSCAYGFKLTQGGRSELKVLLNQNDIFDENGNVSYDEVISNHFDADGNVVDFYQVMGSGKGDNLFSEENRHKVNFIGSIENVVGRDITKENDWAYVFAATPQSRIYDVDVTVPLRPVQTKPNSTTSRVIDNPERKPSGSSKRV